MWIIGSLISFLGLLQILPYYASAQDALPCVNPLGSNGLCINIKQCQPLLQILQEQRSETFNFLRASVCGFEGNDPRVCCPNNNDDNNNNNGNEEVKTTSYGPLQPPICGTSLGEHDRIVNGVPATLGSWPWITALGYRSKKNPDIPRFLCGGALVSVRHVVTAGHCVYQRNDLFMARLGDLDLNSTTDGADPINILILNKILHPKYNPTSYTNDIAIIKLAEDVPFSQNIHPICLPIIEPLIHSNFDNTFPFIAGWGAVYFNGPSSSRLLELQIPVVNQERCKNSFKSFTNAVIDDRIICAGFARGGKDACQGDSGGPLMTPHNNSYYLIGVVSYGYRCAEPGYPGVYSKVSSFLNFIIENLI
ncbi:venom protease-like [Vespa mandarinia]|uniref:venom protease-like n=1 Tax=Vespa mandarinia TaxID=7446 RepID=UPI00161141A5|nr:venom protease-like [Vespa mandarinia]XP_035739813.1 venom protease-like [Vespa mandarinia]XP_035739814.1 venom protease-like [Vespa mandarinia]XP_035739815.1 venom protease-like [Vespa mandarinia]